MSSEYGDIAGVATIIGAFVMKILNELELTDINTWSILVTAIGGAIYLYYKIKAKRIEARIKDIEYKLVKRKLNEKI